VKIFDSREWNTKELAKHREALLQLGWERRMLEVGDYYFNGLHFGIVLTRKTISDLLSSITNNFGEQLRDMKLFCQHRIILLEGNWSMLPLGQKIVTSRGVEYLNWNMAWNFLRTWQDQGFTLEITLSPAHTIVRLESLYQYYQKPEHKGGVRN
jgi:ERCC4-type nuclease